IETIADKVREYFKVFPNLTFEQVEGFIPGLTIENFRMIKSRYKKKNGQEDGIKNNHNTNNYTEKNLKPYFQEQPKNIKELSINGVEKLIINMLNNKSSIPESQIRIAVDFMVKLKGGKAEGDDLEIDAKYLRLADSEENTDPQPGDIIKVDLDMEAFRKQGLSLKDNPESIDTESNE
ncbi:hypothetical protein LCGC14_2486160, partial [marine sediment metagenome]